MNKKAHCDVAVLGGGAAGVAAAVAAARSGMNVALVEKNSYLGGKATAAEVGTLCGLYQFSKNKSPEYIAGRFARDFAEGLKKDSGTEPQCNVSGLHYLPYSIEAFKNKSMELLLENKVRLFLDAELFGLKMSEFKIESVSMIQNGESILLEMNSIVDGSGDSLLSQLADLPTIQSETYQAAAQVFRIQGIGEITEPLLGMVLMKELRLAIMEKKLPDYFDRVYIVPGSLQNQSVSLKIGIPIEVTRHPENLSDLTKAAHRFVRELTEYLVYNVPVFTQARLLSIAPEVGIRVGLRTLGQYILTEEDVLTGRKFEDAIANSSWPVEEWGQDKRVKMRYLKEGDYYQVPARCLESRTIPNLFSAGRCISATDGAIASARVMGTCLQTGYAAGCLAAGIALNMQQDQVVRKIQEQEF
jgi:hypothetical protein